MKNAQVNNSAASDELAVGEGVKVGVIVSVVDGDYMRRLQALAKRVHRKSARQVAEHFGVTRATFKAWESGKKVITEDTAERARRLYELWLEDGREVVNTTREKTKDVIRLTFAGGFDARMRSLEIPVKPKKCRVCKKWFPPVTRVQRRCSVCVREGLTGRRRRKK